MSFPTFDPEPATPGRCVRSVAEWGGLGATVGALLWVLGVAQFGGLWGVPAAGTPRELGLGEGILVMREHVANGLWHGLAATLLRLGPGQLVIGVCLGMGIVLGVLAPIVGWKRLPRPLAGFGLLVGSLVLLLFAGARLQVARRPVPDGPNVLLVVLDTLRRDRLTPYGYERPTTPRLERLADEGLTFTNAYSVSSWTCPSHASLFTGLYPVGHGVTQEAWSLPSGHRTLAEVLWEEGYRTMGSVGNPMVGMRLGFEQGFERYYEDWRGASKDTPADAHPAVRNLEELVLADDPRPFFAFINLIEVHSPYRSGPHLADFDRHPEIELSQNDWRNYFTGGRPEGFTPQELEHLSDLYDGELRYTDDIVGAALDVLEARGVLDETLVIVTSDHGEHFGEHALVDHVFNLYEGNVAVPLIVRYPPAVAMGSRSDAPVQLQDLFPTVLRAVGADRWVRGTEGVDLLDVEALDPERALLLSYGYPDQAFGACGDHAASEALAPYRQRLWGLRQGWLKLIVAEPDEGEARLELYDLAADPGEEEDLARTEDGAARADALRRELERLRASFDRGLVRQRGDGGGALDAETHSALNALGYAEDAVRDN